MDKVTRAAQMRQMDQDAMKGAFAIAPEVLMENAGHAITRHGGHFVDGWSGKDVVILCGKGNNGGDGFVVARHILTEDARVYVYLFGGPETYSDEAKAHLHTLQQMADDEYCIVDVFHDNPDEWTLLTKRLQSCHVIVDALVGTGFHGDLRYPLDEVVAAVNEISAQGMATVISVDMPSGVNADTGACSGAGDDSENSPVFADLTVTFGTLKRGLLLYPGRTCAGVIKVDPIGMPRQLLLRREEDAAYLLEASDIAEVLVPRSPDSYKGTHGTVAIVTGSSDMAGAALMASRGAMRAGGGKIFLRVPGKTAPYCIGQQPEIMVHGVGDGAFFTESDAELILKESSRWSVIAMGPGMGRHESTKNFIKNIIAHTTCPIVLDADALMALQDERDFISSQGQRLIMTPHLAEFSHLAGIPIKAVKEDIIGVAKEFVRQWRVTLVLKGAPTVVVSPKTLHAYINSTGNAGMACGGMGDVLTGMTAAIAVHAGMTDLCSAACAAVYIHGQAGDYCYDTYGSYGFSPMDVADAVPRVIKKLEQDMPIPVLQQPLYNE